MLLFPRPGCTGLPNTGGLEGRGGTRSHCGFHWAWSGHTNSCTRVALSVHSCSTYDDFLPRVSIILQGPEKHTNIKEYFPEKGFDVLPAVPGHRATSLSAGTAVNDDFRVGSGASPAILRPFRDSHFVTSRRRACRQDVGVLPRKSPGKAHCVWRLPRFTGTGAIHRSFSTFGSFGFPLGQLVRGRSVSDRVEARQLTRPLNFTLWLMQRCLKRGRWAQGTNP